MGLKGDRAARLREFEQALKLGFDQFSFRIKPAVRQMDLADTVRIEVAIQYRTRAWQTIEVDLGPVGATTVDLVAPAIQGLRELGVPSDFSGQVHQSQRAGCPEAARLHRPEHGPHARP